VVAHHNLLQTVHREFQDPEHQVLREQLNLQDS